MGTHHIPSLVEGIPLGGESPLSLALGIDHNNLTMQGGDFNSEEISRLWDQEKYYQVIDNISKDDILPLTINPSEWAAVITGINTDLPDFTDTTDFGEAIELPDLPKNYNVVVAINNQDDRDELISKLTAEGYTIKGSKPKKKR